MVDLEKKRSDEDLIDLLIAVSVVAKLLAEKIRKEMTAGSSS